MKWLLFMIMLVAVGCQSPRRELTKDDLVQLNEQGVDGGLAREIFVTKGFKLEGSGDQQAELTFWLLAPANLVVPCPTCGAAIPPSTAVDATNGVSWGYTTAELTAIRAGTTVVQTLSITQNELTVTDAGGALANFRASVDIRYTNAQNALDNLALPIKTIGMARTNGVWGAAP